VDTIHGCGSWHHCEQPMARQPRYALIGQPQHVIQRGNNRSTLFTATAHYRLFFDCLREACERHGCRVHAYVLMTNHVHFLMTPDTRGGIGKVMQSIGRRYVQYFNLTTKRTGTLWEGRYRATVVDTERYLLACYRYIELNPVRAGLVTHPRDYRWSSYRANALGVTDPLVAPHASYTALGAENRVRQTAYRALFREGVDEPTLHEIREATNKGWALGRASFRDEISRLDRRAWPSPKGGARSGRRSVEHEFNRV
jgi:putative transposase